MAAAPDQKDYRCTVAVEGDDPIAEACRTGGIVQAKKLMKDLERHLGSLASERRHEKREYDPAQMMEALATGNSLDLTPKSADR